MPLIVLIYYIFFLLFIFAYDIWFILYLLYILLDLKKNFTWPIKFQGHWKVCATSPDSRSSDSPSRVVEWHPPGFHQNPKGSNGGQHNWNFIFWMMEAQLYMIWCHDWLNSLMNPSIILFLTGAMRYYLIDSNYGNVGEICQSTKLNLLYHQVVVWFGDLKIGKHCEDQEAPSVWNLGQGSFTWAWTERITLPTVLDLARKGKDTWEPSLRVKPGSQIWD